MLYSDGHVGWLVTSDELTRRLLTDSRLSNRLELLHLPVEFQSFEERYGEPTPPGFFFNLDPPDHTRFRRQLTRCFNTRRLKELTPHIDSIVADQLDSLERSGPPADLVELFALPVPARVISELLGVPYEDREKWHRYSEVIMGRDTTPDEGKAAFAAGNDYMLELVQRKRNEPDGALLSTLALDSDLTDEELAGVAWMIHAAGYETTASMLSLAAFALLTCPDQLDALRSNADLIESAVEELLRYLTIVQFGAERTAIEDIEVDGMVVEAGQGVVFSLSAANRDLSRFDRPDELDITREPNAHLAFGRGIHACIGQQLARIELRAGLTALLGRFPELRLACPVDQVVVKLEYPFLGVERLPVAW